MTRGVRLLVVLGLIVSSVPLTAQRVTRRLFVRMTDRSGGALAAPGPADFVLFENAQKREVTRVGPADGPMRILLIVDSSGSVGSMLTHIRAGLQAFFETLGGDHEIGIVTTGGQLRIRVPPTDDRARLTAAAGSFAPDGGANSLVYTLLEADRRWLKPSPRWPVLVLLTTDNGEARGEQPIDSFNRFVSDFVTRGGNAHAIVLKGKQTGFVSDYTQNLVDNVGGLFEVMNLPNVLDQKMAEVALRIATDHASMAGRYEVEYATEAKSPQRGIVLETAREGVKLQISTYRPF